MFNSTSEYMCLYDPIAAIAASTIGLPLGFPS